MKKILSVMLIVALIVLPVAAMAEYVVKVNEGRSSNYRSEPSLDGEDIGDMTSGEEAVFAEETSTDDRGVVWYQIWIDQSNDKTAWISSKYTTLTDGEVEGLAYDSAMVGEMKVLADDTLAVDPFKGVGTVEVKKDAVVYCNGYSVIDGDNTFVKVGNGEGEEGWMNLANLEKIEEEEAVELRG